MEIGLICNDLGSLKVKDICGIYCWAITDNEDTYWEKIPKELYDALVKFETERKGPF